MASQIPRLVLHVGIHRTGTTTLQSSLEQLRPQLQAHGVALVTIGQMKQLRNENAWSARRRAGALKVRRFLEELRSLVSVEVDAVERLTGAPARQVLVTNERLLGGRMPGTIDHPLFRPGAEAAIRSVIKVLNPDDVHVALYTRRQDRLMESCYLWEIQKGLAHSLRDQFPYLNEPVLSFSRLADRIAAMPRVDSLRVRPFETIAGGSLRYLEDFLRNVDLGGKLEYSDFEIDPLANRSYSHRAVEIALLINGLLETKAQRNAARRFLKRQFAEYPPARILGDEDRRALVALYREDNERLFATWMPDLPGDAYSTLESVKQLASVLPDVGSGS